MSLCIQNTKRKPLIKNSKEQSKYKNMGRLYKNRMRNITYFNNWQSENGPKTHTLFVKGSFLHVLSLAELVEPIENDDIFSRESVTKFKNF